MKAVFIDRDGVVNVDRNDYVKSQEEFEFIPGSLQGLKILKQNGFPVFIVSNQSPINRGIFSFETLSEINGHMLAKVRESGGDIRNIFICPHRPDENCECRKPKPGMLLQAKERHHIDLKNSYFVGDAITDIEAGKKAGCKTVLVKTGKHDLTDFELGNANVRPDYVCADLLEAAKRIIDLEKRD